MLFIVYCVCLFYIASVFCAGIFFWNTNYNRTKSIVLVLSSVIPVIGVMSIYIGVSFKIELYNIVYLLAINLGIVLVISYAYVRAKFIILKLMCLIALSIFSVFLIHMIFNEEDGSIARSDMHYFRKSLNEDQYTVMASVTHYEVNEDALNTETVRVEIYKKFFLLPFLEWRIHTSIDVNRYVRNADYINGVIILSVFGKDREWTETINVDK